jgi:hypothetical protein
MQKISIKREQSQAGLSFATGGSLAICYVLLYYSRSIFCIISTSVY